MLPTATLLGIVSLTSKSEVAREHEGRKETRRNREGEEENEWEDTM